MKAAVTFLLHFAFIFSTIQARSIIPQPKALRSFKVNNTQLKIVIMWGTRTKKYSWPLLLKAVCLEIDNHREYQILDLGYKITQNVGSCSYSVSITTSCSSPRYTRDQISIAFGDAYGYQVYAPRIDNPRSRAFESCSTDTFQISGPCTYQICYVYLYRSGYDGWLVDTVTIYGHNTKAVTFYYNAYIPSDVWFGFNLCHGASASSTSSM